MKTILNLTLAFTFFVITNSYAQSIQGIATYKTQRKMDIQLDSTSQANDQLREQMIAMLKKQFEKEFTLEFTEKESLYKEAEALDNSNTVNSGGVQVVVMGNGGGNDRLYKNLEENRFADKREMFSKEFLIKDTIESRDWKLEKETKNIGAYTCFKATYTDTRTISTMTSDSDNPEGDQHTEEEEEYTVVAWYTPQIPVKNGPRGYGGLPGLILEVNDGNETILCSKLVLNPKEGVSIKEPKKGKVVNNTEYEAIMEKKMKEMRERFESDGRRNDGNSVNIQIRG